MQLHLLSLHQEKEKETLRLLIRLVPLLLPLAVPFVLLLLQHNHPLAATHINVVRADDQGTRRSCICPGSLGCTLTAFIASIIASASFAFSF